MKPLAKAILNAIATLCILPALLMYWASAAVTGKNRALEGSSQLFASLPGLPGVFLRRAFLKCVLTRCHSSAEISFGTLFSQTGATLDEDVYVGPRCQLGWVHLERDVLLAAGVHVPSGGFPNDDVMKEVSSPGLSALSRDS